MSKASQGFRSTSSRGVAPRPSVRYTEGELAALQKLEPDSGYGPNTALCDVCGRPITSVSRYASKDERYDYQREATFPHENGMGRGRHVACHAHKMRIDQERNAEAFKALTPEQKEALEAKQFNETGGVDTRDEPLRPIMATTVTQQEADRLTAQQNQREAEIRAQFLIDMGISEEGSEKNSHGTRSELDN